MTPEIKAWEDNKIFARVPKNKDVVDALPLLSAEESEKYLPLINENMAQSDITANAFEYMLTAGNTYTKYNQKTKQDDRFEIVKVEKITNGFVLITTKPKL